MKKSTYLLCFLSCAVFAMATAHAGDDDKKETPKKIVPHTGAGGLNFAEQALNAKLRKTGDTPVRGALPLLEQKKPRVIKAKPFLDTLKDYIRDANAERIWDFLTAHTQKKSSSVIEARAYNREKPPHEEDFASIIEAIQLVKTSVDKMQSIANTNFIRFNATYFAKINDLYKTATFSTPDGPKTGAAIGKEGAYKEAYTKQLLYYYIIANKDKGAAELKNDLIGQILSEERIEAFHASLPIKTTASAGDSPLRIAAIEEEEKALTPDEMRAKLRAGGLGMFAGKPQEKKEEPKKPSKFADPLKAKAADGAKPKPDVPGGRGGPPPFPGMMPPPFPGAMPNAGGRGGPPPFPGGMPPVVKPVGGGMANIFGGGVGAKRDDETPGEYLARVKKAREDAKKKK